MAGKHESKETANTPDSYKGQHRAPEHTGWFVGRKPVLDDKSQTQDRSR